jgi:biotin carboxylase
VRAARALGIERGVAKGDLVWTPDGPKVIEIAARLSGGDFCESLVPLSTALDAALPEGGVNYVRAAIQIALGAEPRWDELALPVRRHVANRYFFPPPGRLAAIEGVGAVRAQPWVRKLELCYQPGEIVPPPTSHATRAGVFVVVADDAAELARRIDWVYRTLRVVVAAEPARARA